MKTLKEIQRAHDCLVAIAVGEVRCELLEVDMKRLAAAASVLCWVLEHDHNPTFGKNLKAIEDALRHQGYVIEDTSN